MEINKARCWWKGGHRDTRNPRVGVGFYPEIAQVGKRCRVAADVIEILVYNVQDKTTGGPEKGPAEKCGVCFVEGVDINICRTRFAH